MSNFNHVNGNVAPNLNHVNGVNGNVASNNNDPQGWYIYPDPTSNPSHPRSPVEGSDSVDFGRTLNPQPTNVTHANFPLHSIIPDDLMENNVNQHANFLDFPPIEVPSAEEHAVRYFGVVKSVGAWEEKTAVVRTIDGCDVPCSTEGCEGLSRLRPLELCQIVHYRSGESAGRTFVSHAAAECTPLPSGAVTRVPSPEG